MVSLFGLPQSIWRDMIELFLKEVEDLAHLDSAVCNKRDRTFFLNNIGCCKRLDPCVFGTKAGRIRWFALWNILVKNVLMEGELTSIDRPYVKQLFANASAVVFENRSLQHDLALCVSGTALKTLVICASEIEDFSCLSSCTTLSHFRLTDCPNVTDEDITRGIAGWAELIECYIMNCNKLGAGAVVALLNHCVHLTTLSLEGCFDLEEVFTQITAKLELDNLICLDVPNQPVVLSGAAIRAMARVTSQLHTLRLHLPDNSVLDRDIEVLVRSCRGLGEVSFNGFRSITSVALIHMAQYLPDLYSLCIDECSGVTDEGVVALSISATKLETLSLNNVNITDAAVQAIGVHCRELRSLSVYGCSSLTDNALTTLNAASLQILNISGTRVTGTFATHILSSHAVLDSLLCAPAEFLTADFVHSLSRNAKLTTVVLGSNQLTEADWLELSTKFPSLHTLFIMDAPAVTDAVAMSFRTHCPNLFSSTLSGCSVSAEVAALLAQRL